MHMISVVPAVIGVLVSYGNPVAFRSPPRPPSMAVWTDGADPRRDSLATRARAEGGGKSHARCPSWLLGKTGAGIPRARATPCRVGDAT